MPKQSRTFLAKGKVCFVVLVCFHALLFAEDLKETGTVGSVGVRVLNKNFFKVASDAVLVPFAWDGFCDYQLSDYNALRVAVLNKQMQPGEAFSLQRSMGQSKDIIALHIRTADPTFDDPQARMKMISAAVEKGLEQAAKDGAKSVIIPTTLSTNGVLNQGQVGAAMMAGINAFTRKGGKLKRVTFADPAIDREFEFAVKSGFKENQDLMVGLIERALKSGSASEVDKGIELLRYQLTEMPSHPALQAMAKKLATQTGTRGRLTPLAQKIASMLGSEDCNAAAKKLRRTRA